MRLVLGAALLLTACSAEEPGPPPEGPPPHLGAALDTDSRRVDPDAIMPTTNLGDDDASALAAFLLHTPLALVSQMQVMPFDRAMRSLKRGLEMSEVIAPYHFPATVVRGRHDAAIRLARELADAGTDSRLVVWETDSHMLPLTHAGALAELIFAA